MKILIAEDDENMSKILKLYLQKEGYQVNCVANGADAVSYFDENRADLLLLDWMLPKKDGISVCKDLRALHIPIKIILLTAKTTTNNEFQGLSSGADDYIRKPFDMGILLLRIKKICHLDTLLQYKDIVLNPVSKEVMQGQKQIKLTKTEYELLKYFMSNPNIMLSREKIIDYVWGIDYSGDLRTVDTHIRRLRQKIGGSYIHTRFGSGYIMETTYE